MSQQTYPEPPLHQHPLHQHPLHQHPLHPAYPILGIDVSKKVLDVCLLDHDRAVRRSQVPNTLGGFRKLIEWVASSTASSTASTTKVVGLESTGCYSLAVTLYLYKKGYTVYLLNPAVTHAALGGTQRRTKTDRTDALDIAYYIEGHERQLRPWEPIPESYQHLRELARELQETTRDIIRTKGRMEKVPYRHRAARTSIRLRLQSDLKHLARKRIAILKEIEQAIAADPALAGRYERLKTITGVGPIVAVTYMAEIPEPARYRTARQIAAHAGVTPRLRHSGQHTPASQPISRIGSRHLRQALYQSALTAKQYNPVLQPFVERLKSHGKPPKVIQIAVARKLIHIIFAMEKHQAAFDREYLSKRQIRTETN